MRKREKDNEGGKKNWAVKPSKRVRDEDGEMEGCRENEKWRKIGRERERIGK